MNRRDAILRVGGIMGISLTAPLMMGLTNFKDIDPQSPNYLIDDNHKKMIEAIAELILPETSTPGAKAAQVPEFIIMMIEECYAEKDKTRFYQGITDLNDKSRKNHNKDFLSLSPKDQTSLLIEEQKAVKGVTQGNEKQVPFISMIRELTLVGYFTSEIGCTKTLSYVPIPGRFDPCIAIEKGQKASAL